MRIALFEPSPRICGPTAWARHVQHGFRELGHTADIVSVTKSGKPSSAWNDVQATYTYGFHWAPYRPDVTVSLKTARAVFDSYDLIVLAEPKCAPHDRLVYRKGIDTSPLYLEALALTKTPWLTALHGPQYDAKLAPFLERCLGTGNFLGKIITPSKAYANDRLAGVELHEYPCLPYRLKAASPDAHVPSTNVVGFAGRTVINKGPQLLVYLACHRLLVNDIEIHGASSVSVGPSVTASMYEYLIEHDFKIEMIMAKENHAKDVLRPHRWRATREGQHVNYCGNYSDPALVFPRFQVHVNFTSVDFSFGLIEYVGLEALDFGCVGVYPPHTLGAAPYEVIVLDGFTNPPAITQSLPPVVRIDRLADGVLDTVKARIDEALSFTLAQRQQLAAYNREVIREHHDPAKFAAALLELTA
jgi:hypothetical protein